MVRWIAKVIFARLSMFKIYLKMYLFKENKMETPDRKVLEDIIIPYINEIVPSGKILFVGSAWYTRHYKNYFTKYEYWTLDYDKKEARFGSENHIIDSIENVANHFDKEELDVIICNGILGWGLNDIENAEKAFMGCSALLKPGGYLLIGWNDEPEHKLCDPGELKALSGFSSYVMKPLGTDRYRVDDDIGIGHVFDFFRKTSS